MRWIGLLLSLFWIAGQTGIRAESATQVELWKHHQEGYPDSNEHSNYAPDNGGVSKISDDFVIVRELF
jgi:hypothetical protein